MKRNVHTRLFLVLCFECHFFLSTQHYVRKGVDEDAAVSLYYERLAAVQARGEQSTHQVLRDIFKEVGFIR